MHIGVRDFISLAVDLDNGKTYYASILTLNGAELTVRVNSSSVTVDASAPVVEYVLDAVSLSAPTSHAADGVDVEAVASDELSLGCSFATFDLHSGLRTASWCLGTIPGTRLSLSPQSLRPSHPRP